MANCKVHPNVVLVKKIIILEKGECDAKGSTGCPCNENDLPLGEIRDCPHFKPLPKERITLLNWCEECGDVSEPAEKK